MVRRPLVAASCTVWLCVTAAPGIEAGREKIYRLAGVGKDARGKPAPVETLSFESSGIHVTVRYLDGASRRAALASALESEIDLFPEGTASSRGHLVFAVEFENRSGGDLIFEPGQSRLITDRHDAEFPLDYTSLHEALSRYSDAPALEVIERAVYARAVTIRPGGSIRKLLVFEGPRDHRYRRLEVRIGALHTAAGDLDGSFMFRKFEVAS